jgi:integrase
MAMTEELEQLLKNLKLRRMLSVYDEQLHAAEKAQVSYSEFVAGLLRAQLHDRQESALEWRIRRANLPERWSLESFPYTRQPGVNRKQIRTFAELDFVAKHENLPNARNAAMTRAGFEYILRRHVHTTETRCSTLASKHVSPHVLRHTCALTILQATKDLRKVSLWLGHSSMQTTESYTRADRSVKLEALESVIAAKLRTGRFKATDKLIEMLKAAPNMRSKKTAK